MRSPRWACFAASFAWSPWPLPFLRQVGWLQALPGLAVWTLLQSRRRPGVGAAPSLAREGRCGSANTRVTTSRWDCREMPESRSFAHVVLGVLLESLELQKKRKMGREVRQASLSHNLRRRGADAVRNARGPRLPREPGRGRRARPAGWPAAGAGSRRALLCPSSPRACCFSLCV